MRAKLVVRIPGNNPKIYEDAGYKVRTSTHQGKPCMYLEVETVVNSTVRVRNSSREGWEWLLNASEVQFDKTYAQVVCSADGGKLSGVAPKKSKALAHFTVNNCFVLIEASSEGSVEIYEYTLIITPVTVIVNVQKIFPLRGPAILSFVPEKFRDAAKAALELAKNPKPDHALWAR